MTVSFGNEEEKPNICVFLLEGTPVMYFGELYYDVEDREKNKLIFKRAVLNVIDPKTKETKWVKVPTAGKDSLVEIDTRHVRGILVKNIDPEEIEEYKRVSMKLYSKLHSI